MHDVTSDMTLSRDEEHAHVMEGSRKWENRDVIPPNCRFSRPVFQGFNSFLTTPSVEILPIRAEPDVVGIVDVEGAELRFVDDSLFALWKSNPCVDDVNLHKLSQFSKILVPFLDEIPSSHQAPSFANFRRPTVPIPLATVLSLLPRDESACQIENVLSSPAKDDDVEIERFGQAKLMVNQPVHFFRASRSSQTLDRMFTWINRQIISSHVDNQFMNDLHSHPNEISQDDPPISQ